MSSTNYEPNLMDQQKTKGIITVGNRATLPKLFVESESSNHLRYRTRSICSEAPSSPNYDSPSSNRMSPSYGTPGSNYMPSQYLGKDIGDISYGTTDSGFQRTQDFSSSSSSSPDEKSNIKFANPFEHNVPQSPLEYIKKRIYKKRVSLFDTEIHWSSRLIDYMPIVVISILLASSIFTILFFTSAFHRDYSNTDPSLLRGKYAAINYAINKKVADGKILEPITDEDGVVLRGKRAAIQFAFNKKMESINSDKKPTVVQEEKQDTIINSDPINDDQPDVIINEESVVINDEKPIALNVEKSDAEEKEEGIEYVYDMDSFESLQESNSETEAMMEDLKEIYDFKKRAEILEAKRQNLMEKLASVGQFSVTNDIHSLPKTDPNADGSNQAKDIPVKPEDHFVKITKKVKRHINRNQPQSKANSPFRKHDETKDQAKDEDDPFSFR